MKYLLFIPFLMLALYSNAQTDTTSYAAQIEAHRTNYKADFLKHDYAPLDSNDIQYLRFYAADSSYQVTANFTRTPDAEEFKMATYSGITKPYVKYGDLEFELGDTTLQMAIYQSLRLRQMPQYREYLLVTVKGLKPRTSVR